METYLHISSIDDKNIAVIKIQEQNIDDIIKDKNFIAKFRNILKKYYGYIGKIHSIEIITKSFIEIKISITVGVSKKISYVEDVFLNETWLY